MCYKIPDVGKRNVRVQFLAADIVDVSLSLLSTSRRVLDSAQYKNYIMESELFTIFRGYCLHGGLQFMTKARERLVGPPLCNRLDPGALLLSTLARFHLAAAGKTIAIY